MEQNGQYYDVPYRTNGPDLNETYPGYTDSYYDNPITYEEIFEKTGYELNGSNSYVVKMDQYYGTELGYTWYHNSDGTMVQVPTEIHSQINHTGGESGYRNGELP